MAFLDDVMDRGEDQAPVVPLYDAKSAYWDAEHRDHKATIEAMKRRMSENAGPDEQEFADEWDRTRLAQKYGAVDELVPRLEGVSVDQDDALVFHRFAEQQDLAPDVVAELVRAAHTHEVAGGGVPRDEDVAALRHRMVSDYGIAPEVFDRLVAWYFSSEDGR